MNCDKEKATMFLYMIFLRQTYNSMQYEHEKANGLRPRKPILGITLKYLTARTKVHRSTLWRSLKALEAEGILTLVAKTWYPSERLQHELEGLLRQVREPLLA